MAMDGHTMTGISGPSSRSYNHVAAHGDARQHNGDYYAGSHTYNVESMTFGDYAQQYNGNIGGDVHHHYNTPAKSSTSVGQIRLWLSAPSSTDEHHEARKKHEPGTGRWLLELPAYQKWLKGPHSVLWLHGKAGCSKTILCSTIIEDITTRLVNTPDARIAYFYFSFRDTIKQSMRSFLLSIISQLTVEIQVPERLLSAYEQNQTDVGTLQSVLVALLSMQRSVYLVADALDECPEDFDNREEIMLGFRSIATACPQLKLLITSRREPDIEHFMTRWSDTIVQVEAKSVDADIAIYVHNELGRHASLVRLPNSSKDDIRRTLTTKSDGMFRWVHCQLDQLKRLKVPSTRYVTQTLENLPKTLDETYERILNGYNEVHEVRTALRWLAFVDGDLTIRALCEACITSWEKTPYVDEGSRVAVEALIASMSSLIQTRGQKVMLAHQSVKEYLVSERCRSGPAATFHLAEGQSAYLIAQDCVAYLLHCLNTHEQEDKIARERAALQGIVSYFQRLGTTLAADGHGAQSVEARMDVSVRFQSRYALLPQACIWTKYQRKAEMHLSSSATRGLHETLLARRSALQFWRSIGSVSVFGNDVLSKDLVAASSSHHGLIIASSAGLIWTVEIFVSEQSAITDLDLGLALMAAACHGHDKVLESLLRVGADANFHWPQPKNRPPNDNECRIAVIALRRGQVKVVERLLVYGASGVDFLLGEACEAGEIAMVNVILKTGAAKLVQADKSSALQAACIAGKTEVADLLLAAGADLNFLRNGNDPAPVLRSLCEARDEKAVLSMLAEVSHNLSPLRVAACRGPTSLLDALLKSDPMELIDNAKLALSTSLRAGNSSCVQFLLHDLHVNLSEVLAEDDTLLEYVIEHATDTSRLRCAGLVLAAGADVSRLPSPVCLRGTKQEVAIMLARHHVRDVYCSLPKENHGIFSQQRATDPVMALRLKRILLGERILFGTMFVDGEQGLSPWKAATDRDPEKILVRLTDSKGQPLVPLDTPIHVHVRRQFSVLSRSKSDSDTLEEPVRVPRDMPSDWYAKDSNLWDTTGPHGQNEYEDDAAPWVQSRGGSDQEGSFQAQFITPVLAPVVVDDTAVRQGHSRHVDFRGHKWKEEDLWTSWRNIVVRQEHFRHVDFLNHTWKEEDLWTSWRNIVSQRVSVYSQKSRLENASWRTWAMIRFDLRTVAPSRIGWLKNADVTWLYGPLKTAAEYPISDEIHLLARQVAVSKSALLQQLRAYCA